MLSLAGTIPQPAGPRVATLNPIPPRLIGQRTVVYQPVETIWVRNVDGTRAFVFFPSGTQAAATVPNGTYRIAYAFARTIAGSALPRLMRNGDSSPELATHLVTLPPNS